MDRLEGTVIAMHGPLVGVQIGERSLVVAARRKLKWEGGRPPDPRLVVGDEVLVEEVDDEGVIVAVKPRRTALLRRAPGKNRAQVIAANVDQALIVFAARSPAPKTGLLDRFLVACESAGIEPVITVNKVDQGLNKVERWLPIYEALGYDVLQVSARTARGLGRIKRRLVGKTTLFCGPSGVGKSSLLNRVYPGFKLKVGSISEATGKGKHITTQAELMPLPYGGFVVDTPGLKEFGLWDLSQASLEQTFPEFQHIDQPCKFANCTHMHEPECAVIAAVEDGVVDPNRYLSYQKILEEAQQDGSL
jgi:ribosome biogenesis GTPase